VSARRVWLVALVLGLALVASACKVSTTVGVTMRSDGSGVLRVRTTADAEAVQAAESGGQKLEQAVRLTDLTQAGWTVGAWARAQDGSASIVVAHRFAAPSELAPLVAQLNGDAGPLPVLAARRDQGLLATDYAVTGRADLEHVATGVLADTELGQRLAAQGVDVAALDQQLLSQLHSSYSLEITVRLPGSEPVRVQAQPGKVTKVRVDSSVRDTNRMLFLVAAAGFALLAVVVGLGGRRRRRRGRRTRGRSDRAS